MKSTEVNAGSALAPMTCSEVISELQEAFDEMMLCTADPMSDEYARKWKRYLSVPGADLGMMPIGIDRDQWKLKQKEPQTHLTPNHHP